MKNPLLWIGKQIASLFRNPNKIAQDAINVINVLKSIVESPLASAVDEIITGDDDLVVNADKWLTEALKAAEFVSANTVKSAIKEAVINLLPMTKEDRGIIYNLIAGQMVMAKTGIGIDGSKVIVEEIYKEWE